MDKFSDTTTNITLKINDHGSIQYIYWMEEGKVIYLDYPSGNPAHAQVYILVTHRYMQDQQIWSKPSNWSCITSFSCGV